MQLHKGVLAALAIGALTLSACGEENSAVTNTDTTEENAKGPVGSVSMALSLPDDSEISSVSYTITGPNGFSRTGAVPVQNSTRLTFRVGGLPVGNGYSIALSAATNFGNTCAGSASFNILTNTSTRVTVPIQCGATDNQGDIIVDGEINSCPVVTSVGAIPGETRLGGTIALSSTISHGDTPVRWSGAGGTFANADAYDTLYTCTSVGTQTLRVAINGASTSCTSSVDIEVICSVAAGCGNGVVDNGEGCDDGNQNNTDACKNDCSVASCGDGVTQTGAEECDDGNGVNTDACSNACDANICGDGEVDPGEACDGTANCNPATCQVLGCGDGIVTAPEQCDDGNTVNNDACSNTCASARCGDGIVQAPEACDDGNTVNGDGCESTCVATPSAGGDIPNQSAACRTCRAANCTDLAGSGFNLVAQCFQNPDPTFVQQCVDLKNCAYSNDCGYNANGPSECFCGTADLSACQSPGAANGPCQAQFFAAARTTVLADLIGSFGDLSLPVGVAFFLQQCDTDSCTACQP